MNDMKLAILLSALALAAVPGCRQAAPAVAVPPEPTPTEARIVATSDIGAGRYLVLIGGCNDCHTPAYARTNGAGPPESEWLKGSTEGHTGPWGTSYGKNLRMTVAAMTEDEWVTRLDTGTSLPPMPWPSVRAMADTDKRALYRYIKSLPGEAGQQAPAALPPGVLPPRPSAAG